MFFTKQHQIIKLSLIFEGYVTKHTRFFSNYNNIHSYGMYLCGTLVLCQRLGDPEALIWQEGLALFFDSTYFSFAKYLN